MSYHLSLNYPIAQSKVTQLQNVQIVASTMGNLFVYDNKQDKLLIISQENISALIPNENKEKTVSSESK
jgi:tmRNA-binding protein